MKPSVSLPPRRRRRATARGALPLAQAVALALAAACGSETPVAVSAPPAGSSIVPVPSADVVSAMPSRMLAAASALAVCGVEPVRPFDVAPTLATPRAALPFGVTASTIAVFTGPAGNPSNPLLSTTGFTLLDFLSYGGTASGGGASVFPLDVNNVGQIVGYIDNGGVTLAYAWKQPGGYTTIAPLPGDVSNAALGNNDAGLVVGYSMATPTAVHAFAWTAGAPTPLGPAFAGSAITYATAVGNSGHIVGYGRFSPGIDHAWRYLGGSFQDLGVPGGYLSSYASAVSNDGLNVAGYVKSAVTRVPAFWRGGSWTVIPLPAGYDQGEATGINASGKVVGWLRVTGSTTDYRGFYYDGTTISIVPTFGGTMSRLWAINDAGMATGYASLTGNLDTHALRYTPSTGAVDLGKEVGACSSYGYGITDDGDVAGNNIMSNTYREGVWPIEPPTRYSLGDRVWSDTDADGTQDAGETGINGVTVKLYDASNVELGSQTTTGDGGYTFGNLLHGTYKVCVTAGVPTGYTQTYDLDGLATPNCATASVGPDRTDVDFGYTPPRGSLGDRVWNDLDGDGTQDAGEPGINGVTLKITGPGGYSATTTTAGDGIYHFANLLAGSYTVCVEAANMASGGALAGFTQTYDLDGLGTPHCATATLAAGQDRDDVDFGYWVLPRYSLGDRVWTDTDADGVQDAGETGINGVTIKVTDAASNVVGTATTAGDGNYTVGNLLAGTYKVCVTAGIPSDYTQTYDLTAPMTDGCATVTLGPSTDVVDFGYTPPRFSLGDRVWYDADGDGVQDLGETGVSNVTLSIAGPAGYSASTTTGANGIYGFSGLLAGSYTVCVASSNMASGGALNGYSQTYDLDGTATPHCATASVGPNRDDVDFGYTKWVGQIGDFTWIDANGNGKQDAGEPKLAGVTLKLGGTSTGTQTSTAAGYYLFSGLQPGSYTVTATPPSGFVATTSSAFGTDTTDDSNASPASVTLGAANSKNLTIDFGFVATAGSGQGCTPGYWKQSQHFDSWKWYTQSDMLDVVFGITAKPYRSTQNNNPSGALTLLQAIELNGNGDAEQLFRHGTAALLNSVYQSGVSYPYTAAQVIQMVRDAWLSGDVAKIEATHQALGAANEKGCPLN